MNIKQKQLEQLYQPHRQDMTASPLYIEGATSFVCGEGDPDATIMFIGEAPGADEDRLGRPFVGRSGKLLDAVLSSIGLRRAEVFITNIVKCRPPENRTPVPEELVKGRELVLLHEINIIQPRVLCTLGLSSLQGLLQQSFKMADVRGKAIACGEYVLIPTYHPAYILRNPAAREQFVEDLRKVHAYSMHVRV